MATLHTEISSELDRVSQRLTQRIRDLADRYETPLPQQVAAVSELENKVMAHLQKMGFSWS